MSTDSDKAATNGDAASHKDQKDGPAGDVGSGEAAPAEAATAEATPEKRLADALGEAGRLRDQLLRTAADFDNFRKRSRKSEDDALRRGREGLLKELLPVFDNLERALLHAEGTPEALAVASGLRMVLKQFVDTLDRVGIKRVVSVGQAFDPTRHEAIQHLESAEHPAGVVVAEVQPGYLIGEILVRPAMVVVSKGPPAADSSGETPKHPPAARPGSDE
jgi:molecular chaperone GrpE